MIPYGRHLLDQDDINAVIQVLKGDWLTCGPTVDLFETALATAVGSRYAVSCSNGTTALHLALVALDICEKDVVLVPSVTFLASANAVRYVGADVAFVDVDPATGLMTPEKLEDAILQNKHKNIKAVINVHLAGQCEDLEKIAVIARKHGLFIIEDAAHAIGTEYRSKDQTVHPIGSNAFADLTTFSFHPVKTIAMGEGGAVTTNDESMAQRLRSYRSHGMLRNPHQWVNTHEEVGPWYYEMHDLGYNYRISDINCALGLSQLGKLSTFKEARKQGVQTYDRLLETVDGVIPLKKLACSDTSWHLYVAFVDFQSHGVKRKDLMTDLKEQGIGTQVHYIPLYKQPYYKELYGEMMLEGAEEYYAKCLSFPLHAGLKPGQMEKIVQSLETCLTK